MSVDFDQWHREGLRRRWITPMFCVSHDGVPYTKAELRADEEGVADAADVCVTMVRVLEGDVDMAPHGRWGDDMEKWVSDETA